MNTAKCGYTGEEVCAYLRTKGMEAEFCDDEYLVLMLTPENSEDELLRLVRAFKDLPLRAPLKTEQIVPEKRKTAIPLRAAMLSRQEIIPVKEADGRICASPTVSCPPAIPIVVSGEVIKASDAKLFRRYGVEKIAVVKQNKAF